MMKKTIASVAIATAALVSASAANASVTLYSVTPATDPYSGPTPTFDFDSSTPTFSGGALENTDAVDSYVRPTGSTGNYYAVGPATSTPGTIDLSSLGTITSISFLWGSVDGYNTLKFIGPSVLSTYTFGGNDILPGADGTQSELVTFLLTGVNTTNVHLQLSSSVNAFEIDDIAINPPVPEPATWAMMLLGFGGIGLAMRRRRSSSKLAQVA